MKIHEDELSTMTFFLFFRFHREDVLAKLLSQLEGGSGTSSGIKCVPSYVAPGMYII